MSRCRKERGQLAEMPSGVVRAGALPEIFFRSADRCCLLQLKGAVAPWKRYSFVSVEDKLEFSNAIKDLFAEGFDCSCLHSSDFGGASLKTFAAPTNGGGVAKRELLVPRPLRAGHTLPRPQQNARCRCQSANCSCMQLTESSFDSQML